MNQFSLKPQWVFALGQDGACTLTSEAHHQAFTSDYTAVLQKLVQGIDTDALDDAEFTLVELLNEGGFLTVNPHPHAPIWELCGANFQSIQEQFKHLKINLVDMTENKVGTDVFALMTEMLGPQSDIAAGHVTLVFADSYQKLVKAEHVAPSGSTIPVICNRMRLTIGPVLFPWSRDIGEETRNNVAYMSEPSYQLPEAFQTLQRGWAAVSLLQFLGQYKTRYVNGFVELDMTKLTQKTWPY